MGWDIYVCRHDLDGNVVPEVLDVLMGFHQNQMCRQEIFLQTELSPCQRMLKPKFELDSLPRIVSIFTCRLSWKCTSRGQPSLIFLLIPIFSILATSKRKQHGPLASVLSNARVLMISRDTWMPSQPWNQLRHSLLMYWVSIYDFPLESIIITNGIFEAVDIYHPDFENALKSKHWLMDAY